MNKLGFMQGRLTDKGGFYPQQFPSECWEQEFEKAAEIGFDCMEWMFNFEQWESNPLVYGREIYKINRLIEKTGIAVSGICANYFMEKNIHDLREEEENRSVLFQLIESAGQINCRNIIIPLFGASESWTEDSRLANILKDTVQDSVNILLETDCEIDIVCKWIEKSMPLNVGLCYDIGNATGLGKDTIRELRNHKNHIRNVHIKDKKVGKTTVMLGSGDAKIEECLKVLCEDGYSGSLILESYYGINAAEDTKENYNYVKGLLEK